MTKSHSLHAATLRNPGPAAEAPKGRRSSFAAFPPSPVVIRPLNGVYRTGRIARMHYTGPTHQILGAPQAGVTVTPVTAGDGCGKGRALVYIQFSEMYFVEARGLDSWRFPG